MNAKDSFTRMKEEKDKEVKSTREKYLQQVEETRIKREKIEAAIIEKNPHLILL